METQAKEQGGIEGRFGEGRVDKAVFVDVSGRRSRRARRIGWCAGIVCSLYVAALAGFLVDGESGAPWLRLPSARQDMAAGPSTVEPVPAPDRPDPVQEETDGGDDASADALRLDSAGPDRGGVASGPTEGSAPAPAGSAKPAPETGADAGGAVRRPSPAAEAPRPTARPTAEPTSEPTFEPTPEPSAEPTVEPTPEPSGQSPEPGTPTPTATLGEPSAETTLPTA
ncbi:hypothetical protein AB0M39_35405 [Streptomyces sp. NPDC051907]|uniref:hypothetical protein n=1 Tax=Streptomyces sp. NPDC051907 TaxID=3155284 RepID=UPI00341E85A6